MNSSMGQKRARRYKNQPVLYDEFKRSLDLTLTPTAKQGLSELAKEWNLSKSELIERIGRGIIRLPNPQSLELVGEPPTNIKPSSIELNTDQGISKGRLPKDVQALINAALG